MRMVIDEVGQNMMKKICLVLVAAALAAGSMGCTRLFCSGNAASFAAGWFARGLVGGQSQQTCYVNGQVVDCSALPDGLGG